jgi:GalNAc-alpha-(1->4)-GalNAc-alpha-(1->3)-diNAcBac-PP-undecaprenol alpha-1,4-N-acetyl-D-galactosaminyltransferase
VSSLILEGKDKYKIVLITPSFGAGGAERVMGSLANDFLQRKDAQVHLIILTGGELFYKLDDGVKIHKPQFSYRQYPRIAFTLMIFSFLRRTLKSISPDAVLSFGGRYNSFVLLSAFGLSLKVFISERSRPGINYGKVLNVINPYVYKLANGIIAQTQGAKEHYRRAVGHSNIVVIGNPVKKISVLNIRRENIVLNVGRFITSKHQDWLIDYFIEIDNPNWQLWFLGEGPLLEQVKIKASNSHLKDNIRFWGNQLDIDQFYRRSRIFAFTSILEGFPNALGEAMSAGCACISYDCVTGPSDLITNDYNGYLIPLEDRVMYTRMLREMMLNPELCLRLGKFAISDMNNFAVEHIADKFYQFILS